MLVVYEFSKMETFTLVHIHHRSLRSDQIIAVCPGTANHLISKWIGPQMILYQT